MEKINVPKLVKDYVEENRYSKAVLARSMGISDPGVWKRLNGDFMEVETLIKFSRSLNHDFFNDISELLGLPKSETEKDVQLAELKKEVEILKRERDLLKEIISSKL